MQLIPLKAVRSWGTHVRKCASAVSTVCPYCGALVTFAITRFADDVPRLTVSGSAKCPSCQKSVHFWTIHTSKSVDADPAAVYMFPQASHFFQASSLSAEVPEALKQSFVSTVDSFNSKNFYATSVGCRRTLEGIMKYLLPESDRRGTLITLIDKAASSHDLAAPLKSLSHAIRDGGNVGAHFDEEKEPTEEMARHMVKLLDYLIAYLYVLPGQITDLEKTLARDA